MNKTAHQIYFSLLSLIVLLVLAAIVYNGYSYYNTSLEERYFHPDNSSLKPGGFLGHGMGILGSVLMIPCISLYMVRKGFRIFSRVRKLEHWLEFYIFLCTPGPILALFHTTFKCGGAVAISFRSMVAVFLSGIVGRFIYIQIQGTIEGRKLSLNEIKRYERLHWRKTDQFHIVG